MEIKKSFIVNKPVEEVWDLLGNRFGAACDWATGLYHSEATGQPTIVGAPGSNRSCDTNQGKIKEEIRIFDPGKYHLAYAVIEGFPGFVKSGVNNWRLTPKNNETQVDIHFVAELQGLLGAIMKPMMRIQLGSVFNQVMEDFKVYVETGKPSKAKAKELAARV